jgi:hypothetical protein
MELTLLGLLRLQPAVLFEQYLTAFLTEEEGDNKEIVGEEQISADNS